MRRSLLHAAKEARACRCIYNGGKRLATRRGNGGVGAFVSNHRRGQFDWQVKGEGGGDGCGANGSGPEAEGGGGELARAPRKRRCPRVRYSAFLGFHHADQPAMAPALPHAVQLPCHAATTDRFDAFRGTARPPLSSHVSPRLRHSPAAPLLTPRPPPPFPLVPLPLSPRPSAASGAPVWSDGRAHPPRAAHFPRRFRRRAVGSWAPLSPSSLLYGSLR